MKWDIPDVDNPLIEAAIGFGDWLARHPLTTDEQRKHILAVREVLRALPEIREGFDGEYGFGIPNVALMRGLPYAPGVGRCWCVCLYRKSLEIFSVYTTLPEQDEIADAAHELFFYLEVGGLNQHIPDYDEWIAEVKDPVQFLQPGYYLEVETSLGGEHLVEDDYGRRYPKSES
jgi:hypothetical protein